MIGKSAAFVGEQWNLLDACGGGDDEIDLTASGIAASQVDRCRQPSPGPCDLSRDREGVERRLNHGETVRATRPLIGIGSDQDAEVQVGDRGDADRRLDVGRRVLSNQHRGVQ